MYEEENTLGESAPDPGRKKEIICPIIFNPCPVESDPPPDNGFLTKEKEELERVPVDTERTGNGTDSPRETGIAALAGYSQSDTGEETIIVPITIESGSAANTEVPITIESGSAANIEMPIAIENDAEGGGESRSGVTQIEQTEEHNNATYPSQDVISPISFFLNQIDSASGSVEPVALNDELGGNYVMDHETMAMLSAPFIQQAKKKGSGAPENIVRLVQQLENDIFQPGAENMIRGEVANYVLKPKYMTIFLARDGQEISDKRTVTFTATIVEAGERAEYEYTIRVSEIDQINNFVKRRCSFAVLYEQADAKVIVNQFRKDTKRIPHKVRFEFAGWVKYAGRYIYLHQGLQLSNAEVVTNLNLPCDEQIDRRDLAGIFSKAVQIYWDEAVSYSLILYSLLGVLYRPFAEAGFPPHFLLFINGITGSFKTSVAKIFFTQLADDAYRSYPRRIDADSMISLEVALTKSGQDTITLLDDFSPAKTTQQKNERENKLEFIIRLVGDGSSKSRSNAKLEDVRGEGIKGMVAVTGELRGKGLSSVLRCLFVELEKDKVDLDALSWFQENPDMFTTFIYHLTVFISEHWDRIVSLIKERFGSYRKEADNVLQAKRLVDTLCTLWLTIDILLIFMDEYCHSSANTENRASWMRKLVQAIVVHSETLSQEDDPAKTFMQALDSLLNRREISLCPSGASRENVPNWDGFIEKGFLFLQPEIIYQKVKQHLKNTGRDLTMDCPEICKLLCDSHYAETASNGKGKKSPYFRRDFGEIKRAKYLKIRLDIFDGLNDNDVAEQ